MSSTNWLVIGVAAAAALAIGGLFLIGDQSPALVAASETSVVGFGAGAFAAPVSNADCPGSCSDAKSCSDAVRASCSEAGADCTGNCAGASDGCSGDCENLAQGTACSGSGARDGSGRGLGQNGARCFDAVETRKLPDGQPCSGSCAGDGS